MILNHHLRQVLADTHSRQLRGVLGRRGELAAASRGRHARVTSRPQTQPPPNRPAHQELTAAREEKR